MEGKRLLGRAEIFTCGWLRNKEFLFCFVHIRKTVLKKQQLLILTVRVPCSKGKKCKNTDCKSWTHSTTFGERSPSSQVSCFGCKLPTEASQNIKDVKGGPLDHVAGNVTVGFLNTGRPPGSHFGSMKYKYNILQKKSCIHNTCYMSIGLFVVVLRGGHRFGIGKSSAGRNTRALLGRDGTNHESAPWRPVTWFGQASPAACFPCLPLAPEVHKIMLISTYSINRKNGPVWKHACAKQ